MATDQQKNIELGLTRLEYQHDPSSERRAVLELTTGKDYRGLTSSATVFWHGQHTRSHAFGIGGPGDFSKCLKADKAKTGTQRNIDNQHGEVFTPEVVNGLISEASAWYAEGRDKSRR